jgi:glutathione S-transferase
LRLYYTPIRRYVHTVEAVISYAGVRAQVEPIPTRPYAADTPLPGINPLGKVPTLVLDDGEYLAGGPVIYEYLDSLHGREPLHPTSQARWRVLRQAWLADGLFDTLVLLIVEGWVDRAAQRPEYVRRCWERVVRALDGLERDARTFGPPCIAQFRAVGALSFLDLKLAQIAGDVDGLDAAFDWRAARPTLASWYARFAAEPWFSDRLLPED